MIRIRLKIKIGSGMKIELVNTGTELLLGVVLNTNQQWLCHELARIGYLVDRQTSVNDTGEAIAQAVGEALGRANLVITTGGLGPTSDDRTRDLVAQLLGLDLVMDQLVRESIRQFFERRQRPQPKRTEVQAMVPRGATVLPNKVGTAPGLVMKAPAGKFRAEESWVIMLPGPPSELRPMFTEQVIPWLRRLWPGEGFVSKTLRSTGIGESLVEEKIEGPLGALVAAGLEVGYCARPGEVDVRLSGRGADAQELVDRAEEIVRSAVGRHVFGTEDETIETVIVRLLTEKEETLAVAESCTGGALANRITNVPGASAVFLGGFVTYSNEAKQKCLGVQASTLAKHGAVSEAVAKEMAEGARAVLGANYALSTTGIAGPTGGSETKPVGTVFTALATASRTIVLNPINAFGREIFKNVTTQQALELLRRYLVKSVE